MIYLGDQNTVVSLTLTVERFQRRPSVFLWKLYFIYDWTHRLKNWGHQARPLHFSDRPSSNQWNRLDREGPWFPVGESLLLLHRAGVSGWSSTPLQGLVLTWAKNGEVELLARNGGVIAGRVGSKSSLEVWQMLRRLKGNYLSSSDCISWGLSPGCWVSMSCASYL